MRRLAALWEEIQALDGDRARLALGMFFDTVTVHPLGGEWAKGWRLEMKTRPAVHIPRGAEVAQEDGCGGEDSNVGVETFRVRLPHVPQWRGPGRAA